MKNLTRPYNSTLSFTFNHRQSYIRDFFNPFGGFFFQRSGGNLQELLLQNV